MAKEVTNEEMLQAINNSFGELEGKMDKRFDKLEKGQKNLEQGHEDIKLKLSNVAYRFELQELENTVKDMQKEIGLLKQKMAAS